MEKKTSMWFRVVRALGIVVCLVGVGVGGTVLYHQSQLSNAKWAFVEEVRNFQKDNDEKLAWRALDIASSAMDERTIGSFEERIRTIAKGDLPWYASQSGRFYATVSDMDNHILREWAPRAMVQAGKDWNNYEQRFEFLSQMTPYMGVGEIAQFMNSVDTVAVMALSDDYGPTSIEEVEERRLEFAQASAKLRPFLN
ncbi:MAG: hypothetical protein ABIH21_01630 [Patescibacteria group bacterium]